MRLYLKIVALLSLSCFVASKDYKLIVSVDDRVSVTNGQLNFNKLRLRLKPVELNRSEKTKDNGVLTRKTYHDANTSTLPNKTTTNSFTMSMAKVLREIGIPRTFFNVTTTADPVSKDDAKIGTTQSSTFVELKLNSTNDFAVNGTTDQTQFLNSTALTEFMVNDTTEMDATDTMVNALPEDITTKPSVYETSTEDYVDAISTTECLDNSTVMSTIEVRDSSRETRPDAKYKSPRLGDCFESKNDEKVCCPVGAIRNFAHAFDKTKYYTCIWGTVSLLPCPADTNFFPTSGICNWKLFGR